ncbi:hypothetical protein, partial [Priestia megaterium]
IMERGTFMNILEIKKTLYTLIQYEDSAITHTIPQVLELSYCKTSKIFQITTLTDQKTLNYNDYDIDNASEALYKILN